MERNSEIGNRATNRVSAINWQEVLRDVNSMPEDSDTEAVMNQHAVFAGGGNVTSPEHISPVKKD